MAGENSDISGQGEWEVLSMTASTLGLPQQKPEESSSSKQANEELAKDEEQTKEGSEDMQPSPGFFHEDLVATLEEPSRCDSPVDSSRKLVKVSSQTHQEQPQSHKYNRVLSIALVVAVVGIAIIGHRWYRERNLNHQLRLELAAKDEKLSDVMQQVKDAVTGRRRIAVTRSSFF